MTPENAIKNSICAWLAYQKCFFWISDRVGIYDVARKQFRSNKSPYRIKGVADILGIWKGKLLAIEVKTPKKYPSPEQREFLSNVIKHGGIGFVARSIDDVKEFLK